MENMKSLQEIANETLPSIVLLEMENSNGQLHQSGSGFFIREDRIVTNLHVVEGADTGSAKLFDEYGWYDIEGYTALDVDNDLIILKVKPRSEKTVDISALCLGNSNSVQLGDTIYAIGNPWGLEGTLSDGIISAIRLRDPSQGTYYTRFQITAPISSGSSGGVILNTKGEVIGVSASRVSSVNPISSYNPGDSGSMDVPQNLNFAIPSNYLNTLLKQDDENDSVTPLQAAKLERVTFIDKLGWVGSASYTFPLQNKSHQSVKNVRCEVIFKDKDGNVIKRDSVVFPWLIPARTSKVVIRLSIYDTTNFGSMTSSETKILSELGVIRYDETDISNSSTESFLLGLADLLLTNMGHTNYSSVQPHVKRLVKDYEIRVVDLEVVN